MSRDSAALGGLGLQSIDHFAALFLDKKLHHGGNSILQMCASNCVIERDAAGNNRKLSKKRSTGKIDGMIALCIAPLRTAAKFDVEALIT